MYELTLMGCLMNTWVEPFSQKIHFAQISSWRERNECHALYVGWNYELHNLISVRY